MKNSDLPSGCFKIESRTNDFKEPEDFYVIREFPIFRRISAEEAASAPTRKRKADRFRPSPSISRGTPEGTYLAASNNEPSMGRDKVDNLSTSLRTKNSSKEAVDEERKHLRKIKGFFH